MIAISYRREDSLPITGRLYDRLQARFGKREVFMDFDSIPPGVDFREQLKRMIEAADVVIAVIGPNWLGEQPDGSRRIDEPTDFVRIEVEYALKRDIPVIPLLVNNTPMPKSDRLPPEIAALAYRNALPLDSGLDFNNHAERVMSGVHALTRRRTKTGPAPTSSGTPRSSLLRWGTVSAVILCVAVAGWVFFRLRTGQNVGGSHRLANEERTRKEQFIPESSAKKEAAPQSNPFPEKSPMKKTIPAVNIATPVLAPTISMGSLVLDTSPSGATVTLGDVGVGKTPVELRRQPGKYQMRIVLDGYDTIEQQVEVKENQPTDLGTISLQRTKSAVQPVMVSAGPKLIPNSVYEGTIHVKNDSSTNIPLIITVGSDLKSGTMTQSGHRGDVVVKFAGVLDGAVLHAVTDEIISAPRGISWEPESFTLRFADDSKSATYECVADGKTYAADLLAQSAPTVNAAPVYKGTIRARGESGSGTPLTINLAADRKSGTMTQSSKSGDTIVRFNGIWDGDILRAVTNEVISKPANIQWKPESFNLHFADDGKRGTYECNSEGHIYSAELFPR